MGALNTQEKYYKICDKAEELGIKKYFFELSKLIEEIIWDKRSVFYRVLLNPLVERYLTPLHEIELKGEDAFKLLIKFLCIQEERVAMYEFYENKYEMERYLIFIEELRFEYRKRFKEVEK